MQILLYAIFLALSAPAEPKTGTISGIIVESGSQTPIVAAEVKVDDTQIGAFSDKAGYYLIANVPVGTQTLLVTREGYRSRNIASVEVKNALRTTLNIVLDPQPSDTYSLESSADYFAKPGDTTASYDHLSAEEIRRSPGSAEDVNLVLQSLPGVAPDYDKSANLIVRGGMPWENLTLVDGFYTGPAVHFSSDMGSGGDVFSTINGKVLGGVDFYAGGFPARYGDRLSSVTAITLRNPATDRFHGEGDFNVVGFSSRLEGPITPWASVLLAGRYSFVEVLSQFMDLGIGGAIPKYYDWQGKSIIVPGQNQQIELLTLGANDRIHLTPEDMGRPYGQDYKSRHAFYGTGYTVNWAGGITELRLSSTDQTWDLLFDQDYTYTRSVGYDLKLDHQLPLSAQWLTRFGGEGGLTDFKSRAMIMRRIIPKMGNT